ncbi:hypothetical protein [Sphingomonas sp. PvP056]|uniref:hypothetical protein n=1 Tax=Sphingomonas sp. PvP056 TaxID=3156392 RepID=UPI0033977DC5
MPTIVSFLGMLFRSMRKGDNARLVFGATMKMKYLSCTTRPARSAVSQIQTGTTGLKRLRKGMRVVDRLARTAAIA